MMQLNFNSTITHLRICVEIQMIIISQVMTAERAKNEVSLCI